MKYTNTTDNVETIPKPNLKIVETEAKSKHLAHICMTAHLLAWCRHFKKMWRG